MSNHLCENLYSVNQALFLWRGIGNTAKRFDSLLLAGIGKKAVMSDLCEILWNNVQKKPSDKLSGCNSHFFDLTVITIVFIRESNHAIIKCLDTGI